MAKITPLIHVKKKIIFKLRSELLSLRPVGKIPEKIQLFGLRVLKVLRFAFRSEAKQ